MKTQVRSITSFKTPALERTLFLKVRPGIELLCSIHSNTIRSTHKGESTLYALQTIFTSDETLSKRLLSN